MPLPTAPVLSAPTFGPAPPGLDGTQGGHKGVACFRYAALLEQEKEKAKKQKKEELKKMQERYNKGKQAPEGADFKTMTFDVGFGTSTAAPSGVKTKKGSKPKKKANADGSTSATDSPTVQECAVQVWRRACACAALAALAE